jgi:O-antigen ligase
VIGITASDYFVAEILRIPSQLYLMIPFYILLVKNYQPPEDQFFKKFSFLYALIILIEVIISLINSMEIKQSFRDYEYLYTGQYSSSPFTYLLVLSVPFLLNYKNINVRYTFDYLLKVLMIVCFVLSLGYFGGSSGNIDEERYTIINQNSNALANTMLVGLNIALFYLLKNIQKPTKIIWFLIISLSLSVNIMATVSRTGISALIIIIIMYILTEVRNKFLGLTILLPAILIFSINFIDISEFRYAKAFIERTKEIKDDPRNELTKAGWKIVLENPFGGLGYDKINSEEWRIANSLYSESGTEDGTNTYGISVHNGFIDLGMIGGFPLIVLFLSLFIYIISKALTVPNLDPITRIFIINNIVIILLFTFTGQGNYQKITWWQIAICFMIFDMKRLPVVGYVKNRFQSSNSNQRKQLYRN